MIFGSEIFLKRLVCLLPDRSQDKIMSLAYKLFLTFLFVRSAAIVNTLLVYRKATAIARKRSEILGRNPLWLITRLFSSDRNRLLASKTRRSSARERAGARHSAKIIFGLAVSSEKMGDERAKSEVEEK
jgi:hypothetical protein